MNAISVRNLSKSYTTGKQTVEALCNISLQVAAGELFGIIGPDGAGKTSLLRILATLMQPNAGQASVLGLDTTKDYKAIRQKIGYMPGRFSLYQDLSVEENLDFFATIFKTSIDANYQLIKDIYEQIAPFKKRKAGKLSGGMKQKLALCCALIHKPSLLLLDEPTTGVDVMSRKEFWDMLASLQQQGLTIVVATPYMDEASLCDRIALLDRGNFLEIDTPSGIIANHQSTLWAVKSDNMYQLLQDTRSWSGVTNVFPFGEYLHCSPHSSNTDIKELEAYLLSKKQQQIVVKQIEPQIEDVFMHLMNKHHVS